jgi:hypothetical protein
LGKIRNAMLIAGFCVAGRGGRVQGVYIMLCSEFDLIINFFNFFISNNALPISSRVYMPSLVDIRPIMEEE